MNLHHKTKEEIEEERQLVERAKEDTVAFGKLYQRYFRQIYVFVYRRTGQEDLAGDLVSDVFLKAMLALPKFEFKGLPFSSWLFRIALNEVNMYYRKSTRDRTISLEKQDLGRMMMESGEPDNSEDYGPLMNALSKLHQDEMQLIELRYFEKRPFSEIGEILGITENNAKVKTYRILDRLKISMKNMKD